jgi:hypothetical protein
MALLDPRHFDFDATLAALFGVLLGLVAAFSRLLMALGGALGGGLSSARGNVSDSTSDSSLGVDTGSLGGEYLGKVSTLSLDRNVRFLSPVIVMEVGRSARISSGVIHGSPVRCIHSPGVSSAMTDSTSGIDVQQCPLYTNSQGRSRLSQS